MKNNITSNTNLNKPVMLHSSMYESFNKSILHKKNKSGHLFTIDEKKHTHFKLPSLDVSNYNESSRASLTDVKTLLSFYKFKKDYEGRGSGGHDAYEHQDDVMKKFHITGKINSGLEKQVTKYLHDDYIHQKLGETPLKNLPKKDIPISERKKLKAIGKIKISDYHFNDPKNVLESLKINKSIHDNITHIFNEFRESKHQEHQDNSVIRNPYHGSVSSSALNHNYKRKIKVKPIMIESPTVMKFVNEVPQEKVKTFANRETRAEYFERNTDMLAKFTSQIVDYPRARSQATMIVYKDLQAQAHKILLFGGLGLYRFNDVWVYDLCKLVA
jgi:hypothetical protein